MSKKIAEAKEAKPKKTAIKTPAKKTKAVTKTIKTKKIEITEDPALVLARIVADGMNEKKAENIRILDLRKIKSASSDFFVISHAQSDKQVEAIANSAEEEVKKLLKENPWHREGYENMEWILLDYINVVAHVFQEEKRDFYALEELWGDAEIIEHKVK